jgi:hypothetical protein
MEPLAARCSWTSSSSGLSRGSAAISRDRHRSPRERSPTSADPRGKPRDDDRLGRASRQSADVMALSFHGFISSHRHSGAAQRNPESSTLVLVQLCDSVRYRADRLGCISFLARRHSGFRVPLRGPGMTSMRQSMLPSKHIPISSTLRVMTAERGRYPSCDMSAPPLTCLRDTASLHHHPLHLWHGAFLSLWMVSFALASCVNPSVDGAASGLV